MQAVFVIGAPDQVRAYWQRVTGMLRKQFPNAVPIMEAARDDVLAFLHFPQEHLRKIGNPNPLERLNNEIKRRTNVVGIFPNDYAITRLVVASCWSSRRSGSWSAAASSLRPPWPSPLSPRSGMSSPMVSQHKRRQPRPTEKHQPLSITTGLVDH
jgi:transposase-like protein